MAVQRHDAIADVILQYPGCRLRCDWGWNWGTQRAWIKHLTSFAIAGVQPNPVDVCEYPIRMSRSTLHNPLGQKRTFGWFLGHSLTRDSVRPADPNHSH